MRKYGTVYIDIDEIHGLLFDHIKKEYGVEVYDAPEVDVDADDNGELFIVGMEFRFEEDKEDEGTINV